MSVTFLQNNKLNYAVASNGISNASNTIKSYADKLYSDVNSIVYTTSKTLQAPQYIDLHGLSGNSTVVNKTLNSYCNALIYNFGISYCPQDITQITSDDTATFTVTVNDNVYNHVFKLKNMFMNTFQFNNVVQLHGVLTTFKVTYTATKTMYYHKMKEWRDQDIAELVLL